MPRGKPAEVVEPSPLALSLANYVQTGEPITTDVLEEFDSGNPKAAIRELGAIGISLKEPDAMERYLKLCQLADRGTDYENYGPEKSQSFDSGTMSRDKPRPAGRWMSTGID